MECPKCHHQQEATDKCGSCGVYFSKLSAPPAPPPAARSHKTRDVPADSRIGFGPFIATAVVTGLLVFWFMRDRDKPSTSSPGTQAVTSTKAIRDELPLEGETDE